jgi:hypothetical protein
MRQWDMTPDGSGRPVHGGLACGTIARPLINNRLSTYTVGSMSHRQNQKESHLFSPFQIAGHDATPRSHTVIYNRSSMPASLIIDPAEGKDLRHHTIEI